MKKISKESLAEVGFEPTTSALGYKYSALPSELSELTGIGPIIGLDSSVEHWTDL